MARSHRPECHSVCFPNRNLGVRRANGSYSGSIRRVLGAYWLFGSVRMHTERHSVARKRLLYMFKIIFIDHPNVAYMCIRERERERNVLFNDALNTFYLRIYGVRHMVKDHSDSEKGNPLPSHRLLVSINSKGSFICTIPQTV